MVPVGGCVLKALECGGDWGEALLPKVMLEYLDAIPVGGEGVAGIDSRGVFLDKQKNVTNTQWDMLEGLRSDDGFAVKESGEPQVKCVVGHAGK